MSDSVSPLPKRRTETAHLGWVLPLALVLIVAALATTGFDSSIGDSGEPESVAALLESYPNASALYVRHADTVAVSYNADRKLPLASTAKHVVAIEYARQAAAGVIDRDSLVTLDRVNRFFVDFGTADARLHRQWMDRLESEGVLQDGQVPLREIARGMIDYSSNPATEYMMDLLTLDSINETLSRAGLDRHDDLYYFAGSALYIGQGREDRVGFLRSLSPEARAERAAEIHQRLAEDADGSYRERLEIPSLEVQKVWSDHLPSSTAREYAGLMAQINDRTLFEREGFGGDGFDSEAAQTYLYETLNALVRGGGQNAQNFSYFGRKSGSTAWILTQAGFGTYRNSGEQIEYVFLFDGSPDDRAWFAGASNRFIVDLFFKPSYRRDLADRLGS